MEISSALWAVPPVPSPVLICVCFDVKGLEGGTFLRERGFEENQIQSEACLRGVRSVSGKERIKKQKEARS